MKLKKLILLNSICLCYLLTFSQKNGEGTIPLQYNYSQSKKTNQIKKATSNNFQFLIDTLNLPIVDDFSTNLQKKYSTNPNNPSLTAIPWAKYKINNIIFDSIPTMNDSVYNYIINLQPFKKDSALAGKIILTEFSHDFNNDSIDFISKWPNYSLFRVNMGNIDTIFHAPNSYFQNTRDTFYVVPDNSTSIWTESATLINNTFAVNPPTTGIATFDGLDSLGKPRNLGSPNSHGISDYLTSKPIRLLGKMDVYLSFYYQPQGYGDFPNSQDSLVLEFLSPDFLQWKWAWSTKGKQLQDFRYVQIAITDTSFLKDGFKFRFKNYASLAGNFDLWHVDYVYLDENRIAGDSTIKDVGFSSIPNSYLQTYTSIPWNHYTPNQTLGNNTVKIRNLGQNGRQVTNRYMVFDEQNNIIFPIGSPGGVFSPSVSPGETTINLSVNSSPNNFTFPVLTKESTFKIKNILETDNDPTENSENDTLNYTQIFSSYYAYDDGSPEQAYFLVGSSAKIAYKYNLLTNDSLKGILMFLPQLLNSSSNFLRIMVWEDNGGIPGNILYAGDFVSPKLLLSGEGVRFERYDLDSVLFLTTGSYFIGFEQSFSDPIYVGFDKNINSASNIYFSTNDSWTNTTLTGSLLIRPDFGNIQNIPLAINNDVSTENSQFFPNPASEIFTIKCDACNNSKAILMDITGRIIAAKTIQNKTNWDVSNLKSGIYFLNIQNTKGKLTSHKIIITH